MHFRIGPADAYFVAHPDLIKEVLVTRQHAFMKGRGLQWAKRFLGEGLLTSEGEFHTRQRRLTQPAFHRSRIQGYGRTMVEHALAAAARSAAGREVAFDQEMMALTLGIVAKTLFDADVAGEAKEIGASLSRLVQGERKEVSSPVGIVEGSSEALERGTQTYLWVLGLLSLSLALLNLLPLLPLDGGHIVFSIIEGVRGRAVGREVYERVSAIGIALVLLLFFIGLSNDIGRLGGS